MMIERARSTTQPTIRSTFANSTLTVLQFPCMLLHRAHASLLLPLSSQDQMFWLTLVTRPAESEQRMPGLSNALSSIELRRQRNSSHIFCNLSPSSLAEYDMIGPIIMVPRNSMLFREGEAGDRLFVLCGGHVKLSCLSKGGRTMNLKIASRGDVPGLSAVISESRFEVSAEAMETTFAKVIRSADFLPFIAHEAEASMYVARLLNQEYKFAFSEARRLALSNSASGRLASLLLDWGHVAEDGTPEMRFTMALTHDDLAGFISTTRETVSRVLGRFQKDKLITIRGHSVHILMPERLAALAA